MIKQNLVETCKNFANYFFGNDEEKKK